MITNQNSEHLRSNIYCEVIPVGMFYRVAITDSEKGSTHMMLARYLEYEPAERYCNEIAELLARYAGEFRNKTLVSKEN